MALSEFDLIARYFRPLTEGRAEAFNLLDDAAVITPPAGRQLVVTTDALVAGRHFLADGDPAGLAHKALGVNLSDLAAMGAEVYGYTLALAAPKPLSEDWLAGFAAGLGEVQAAHGIFLLGGDTVGTEGPLTLSVTAMGWVPQGGALTRGGARSGDAVYLSGTVGDAALGLLVAQDGRNLAGQAGDAFLKDRYERPQPRTSLGPRLVGLATACLDVSDGLAADVGHIAEVSNLGTEIDAANLPLSEAARAALEGDPALLSRIVTGGDDYELAFCLPDTVEAAAEVKKLAAETGIELTRIGTMTAPPETGPRVRVLGPSGAPLDLQSGGFTHF